MNENEQLQVYNGIPTNGESEEEKNWWHRFLEVVNPYLNKKHQQGEALLDAKLRKEVAEARILEEHANQEEIKTARKAHELEQQIMEEGGLLKYEIVDNGDLSTHEQFNRDLEEVSDAIRMLELKHGTRL